MSVDAVLFRLPGDSFVNDGQGISSRLLVGMSPDWRGVWSVELRHLSASFNISQGMEPENRAHQQVRLRSFSDDCDCRCWASLLDFQTEQQSSVPL